MCSSTTNSHGCCWLFTLERNTAEVLYISWASNESPAGVTMSDSANGGEGGLCSPALGSYRKDEGTRTLGRKSVLRAVEAA